MAEAEITQKRVQQRGVLADGGCDLSAFAHGHVADDDSIEDLRPDPIELVFLGDGGRVEAGVHHLEHLVVHLVESGLIEQAPSETRLVAGDCKRVARCRHCGDGVDAALALRAQAFDGAVHQGALEVQRDLASGNGFFDPLTLDQVESELQMLKRRNLGIIAVSGHDSSDQVIARVKAIFGEAHRYLRVGEALVVEAPAEPNPI